LCGLEPCQDEGTLAHRIRTTHRGWQAYRRLRMELSSDLFDRRAGVARLRTSLNDGVRFNNTSQRTSIEWLIADLEAGRWPEVLQEPEDASHA
jgi:hypothetical protein